MYIPYSSLAWGTIGHRVVGQIAEQYLTPKAKAAIQKILGNESIAMVSTWADFIRSDSNYGYLATWHYINFTDSTLNETSFNKVLKADTSTDAYTKINFIIEQLKNKTLSTEKQRLYLKMLIHIIGDIHQPLHAGRENDKGGNKIKVQWFYQPSNLHAVWDEKLIDNQQLSYTEYANYINHTTTNQVKEWQSTSLNHWLFESYQLVNKVYAEASLIDLKLGYRYNFDHIQTVNSQLLKAGVRLAGILNKIFS